MARRRRSFFFDNINKKLLVDTIKNTKDVKDDIDATIVANTNVMTLADVEDKISTELSDGGYATQSYVDTEVAGVVNSAPSTLDTLDELAAALGDDANFATSTATSLGNRLRIDVDDQALTANQQTNVLTNLGITSTVAELNYTDGVTSNIQTQLNAKGTSNFSGSYNDLTDQPTIPTNNNQLTNGAGYQVASTWTSNGTLSNRSTSAPDTAGDSQGINAHYMSSSATNKPTGTDHSLLTMSYSSAWQTQIAADWRNSGRLYVRGQNNGTWSAWNTVWDSGNDGSGSGLDADTLDGIEASGFVRGDGTADPFTMDVGRGDMYVENNANDNQSGAGVTFRTTSNPSSGSESASPGCMFAVRSSGQASRLWVGQSITATGSNSFETVNITASGNITAYSSDKRLKKDFEVIPDALNKVMQISGYNFKWNDLTQEVGFTSVKPDQKDIGVVAQEIQEVLPEVVDRAPFDSYEDTDGIRKSKSGDDYLTVQYEKIVPLLIEAIKEQQHQIEELKEIIRGSSN